MTVDLEALFGPSCYPNVTYVSVLVLSNVLASRRDLPSDKCKKKCGACSCFMLSETVRRFTKHIVEQGKKKMENKRGCGSQDALQGVPSSLWNE